MVLDVSRVSRRCLASEQCCTQQDRDHQEGLELHGAREPCGGLRPTRVSPEG